MERRKIDSMVYIFRLAIYIQVAFMTPINKWPKRCGVQLQGLDLISFLSRSSEVADQRLLPPCISGKGVGDCMAQQMPSRRRSLRLYNSAPSAPRGHGGQTEAELRLAEATAGRVTSQHSQSRWAKKMCWYHDGSGPSSIVIYHDHDIFHLRIVASWLDKPILEFDKSDL